MSTNPLAKLGFTPAKLGLVGILAVILIAVIVFQMWPSSAPNVSAIDEAAEVESSDSRSNIRRPAGTDLTQSLLAEMKEWPAQPLESVLAYDPFSRAALSPAKPEPGTDTHEPAGDSNRINVSSPSLPPTNVRFVMISGNERVAAIGDRMVRVGDHVNGMKVVRIESDRIVFGGANSPPQEEDALE